MSVQPTPQTQPSESGPNVAMPTNGEVQQESSPQTDSTSGRANPTQAQQSAENSSASQPSAPNRGRGVWWIAGGLSFVLLLSAAWVLRGLFGFGGDQPDDSLLFTVVKTSLRDIVVERGSLESQSTVRGKCEVPGYQHKIVFIVPEGSTVQKGAVVVKLDTSELDKAIAQHRINTNTAEGLLEQAKQEYEVQLNTNESSIKAAELEVKLADLDLEKYLKGDFEAEVAEIERSIAEAKAELEKNSEELQNLRELVKDGFRSPTQLQELELRVQVAKFRLERDEQKLDVKKRFDKPRKETEFRFKADEAKRKLARAKKTADAQKKKAKSKIQQADNTHKMRQQELQEFEKYLSNCTIKAPQNGTVAYANRPWYDASERIREGATVRKNQEIFHLPDMTKMQVKVNVHESVINKIKEKQVAKIRIDSFPDQVFTGTVTKVAQLASSSWASNSKNYEAIVQIDSFAATLKLKPGMTAEVEFLVGVYKDVVAIPVNAITEHFQQSYVYVYKNGKFERRQVKVGRSTTSFIEIVDGVEAGDVIAMDAYRRGMIDFGDAERAAKESPSDDKKETPTVTK